ncbi:MAG TPA: undecaprenyl-diphosphate phosphatase [Rhizobiales bacterium]|jgi:undecaprenyl-diphosphatase|nr:undecaprenyl-diphosphate phosphatase [Hyphomicrobiales bacterium]
MSIEQIIVLALVQGITEFLPISSSGHLILIPQLMHWPDQGQLTDVMTHFGTLLAVLIYFWRDVWHLILGTLALFKGKVTDDGRLAIYIVLATIPAIAFGFVLKKFGYADLERNVAIVAWNTILYGILMLIADMVGPQERTMSNMTLGSALIIGTAQALALIPGTSRSGVTMTAARFLGFTRPDSARFSFLLGIPATAGAIVFTIGDALEGGGTITKDQILCAALTFVAGILAIAFLMNLIRRISFLPFVLYRMVLGGFLLVMLYS